MFSAIKALVAFILPFDHKTVILKADHFVAKIKSQVTKYESTLLYLECSILKLISHSCHAHVSLCRITSTLFYGRIYLIWEKNHWKMRLNLAGKNTQPLSGIFSSAHFIRVIALHRVRISDKFVSKHLR